MLARLVTYSLFGIDARAVDVEVDISPGSMPKTILVGLAEAAVRESTHRIERALVNSGYSRPVDRIVINLSPADFPKDASSFDLPIALGLLLASAQLASDRQQQYASVGELSLEGSLRPIKGVLSMALAARDEGRRGLVVPVGNAQEAAVVEDLEIIPVGSNGIRPLRHRLLGCEGAGSRQEGHHHRGRWLAPHPHDWVSRDRQNPAGSAAGFSASGIVSGGKP